jgi:CubicO group peptidase (beta-lactamase class C family)
MTPVNEIAALLDDALVRGVGSAAALSIGDAGVEVERMFRGHVQRVPEVGVPLDEHALFDLASLTKPMCTVACAMTLVGDGQLDLDTSIKHWIPDAASEGTVRHLLGHASGCIAHVEFFRALAVGDHPDRRGELLALAARTPANPPGVATVYTDLGFIQLGAIVERASGLPLEQAFAERVAGPLGLTAKFGTMTPMNHCVATEADDPHGLGRGVVRGVVHDENCFYGGGVAGHAGLFSTLGDVAKFARAIVDTHAGHPVGRFRSEVVQHFARESAVSSNASGVGPQATTWRLGFDTPSIEPGISSAGDRWLRAGAIGHTGFTGTSMWLDLPKRRWVVLLTNRVHPTRGGSSVEDIKALRRAVHDAVVDRLG